MRTLDSLLRFNTALLACSFFYFYFFVFEPSPHPAPPPPQCFLTGRLFIFKVILVRDLGKTHTHYKERHQCNLLATGKIQEQNESLLHRKKP